MLARASCRATAPLTAQLLCMNVCKPNKRSSGTGSWWDCFIQGHCQLRTVQSIAAERQSQEQMPCQQ